MIAVTRPVSGVFNRCELTHAARVPIDVELARGQHAGYERALQAAGCTIVRVAAADDLPDAVFVEDTAVVVGEAAIIARPGAASRRAETPAVAEVLGRYRRLRRIEAPATLDGGDVLVAGRQIFIGRSSRTNDAGIEQMRSILQPYGYTVRAVTVTGCLHLKSGISALSDHRLLINPDWVPREPFAAFELVAVDPREPHGANIVRAGGELIYSAVFPRTRERLDRLGFTVCAVDVSEIAKAEGAVTCCSLIFDDSQAGLSGEALR